MTPLQEAQKVRKLADVVRYLQRLNAAYQEGQGLRDRLIGELLQAGLSTGEICKLTGVTAPVVAKVVET